MKERDLSIDLLKILSCFAVIGLHTFHKDLSLFNSSIYYLCEFAIPVFWMSSGAFLLNRPKSTWRYVLKKILRILVVVILWDMIVSCGWIVGNMILRPDSSINLLYIPKVILGSLVQKGIMFHFWYFGALIIVYILLRALQEAYIRNHGVLLIIFGLICIGFQICSFIIGHPMQKYIIQTFRLWTWLFYFILGGGNL